MPPKRRGRPLGPDQLAKMAAGRERARLERQQNASRSSGTDSPAREGGSTVPPLPPDDRSAAEATHPAGAVPGDVTPEEKPRTVRITTGTIPPPKFKDELATPPSSVPAPAGGKPAKKKWWEKKAPSKEEFSELTEGFSGLIQTGYAGLADIRDYAPWVHDEAQMRPYKTIIRQILKRVEFDPSMLLIALAVIQIAEQEGMTLKGDLKEHKRRKAEKEAGAPPPEGPVRIPEGAI